jgi:hypothetical protein
MKPENDCEDCQGTGRGAFGALCDCIQLTCHNCRVEFPINDGYLHPEDADYSLCAGCKAARRRGGDVGATPGRRRAASQTE